MKIINQRSWDILEYFCKYCSLLQCIAMTEVFPRHLQKNLKTSIAELFYDAAKNFTSHLFVALEFRNQ